MQPAVPDPFDGISWEKEDVGSFEQGSPAARWALGRYLLGRAIAESVSRTLLIIALVLLALAIVCGSVLHSTLLAVLVGIVLVGVLILRWGLVAVIRLVAFRTRYPAIEAQLRALVADTKSDLLRELRRAGLPGRALTLPLFAFRLIGRRRVTTFERLRSVDLERAVPKARLDELFFLVRQMRDPGVGR